MSDSDESSSRRDENRQICRDYLRNICQRGSGCKFLHPMDKEKSSSGQLLTFCHDYQNGKCGRYDCKFIHCTDGEEEHYRQTGELPPRMMGEPWNKWVAAEVLTSKLGENVPVCKDFLNNECLRRNCRFRHVNLREIEPPNFSRDYPQDYDDNSQLYHRRNDRQRPAYDEFEPNFKRRRFMDAPPSFQNGHFRPPDRALFVLEEENAILRQRVAELKKRVDDLGATNEFLLEQNAQMRNEKGAPSLTAVTVPAVTITNTAQMQAAQAPNHPVMNAAIRTVTASVATVPVSIAAVTATPCSIATVSMAPVPIPPAVVTMAQSASSGPMSISEPPGPLVSYPIMTRPVLQSDINH